MSTAGCTMDTGTANVLKFDGLWTDEDNTLRIKIDITGWTNPSDSSTITFSLATYDSTSVYLIDTVDLTVAAEPLELTIS
jgi:hypothetical protein